MNTWQQVIVLLYGLLNLIFFFQGYAEITKKKNALGLTNHLVFLGVFVWGDILVLSPFWLLTCVLVLILNDWYLFLLILSVFWSVRSLGETIYWLQEQFAEKHRNPPHTLLFYQLFKSDAVWFVYQLFWQCMLVLSLILSLYLGTLWLSNG